MTGSTSTAPRARFPGLRAIEALATSVPLFLLLFAGTYVVVGAVRHGRGDRTR